MKFGTAVVIAIAVVLLLGAFKTTYPIAVSIVGIVLLVWTMRWAQQASSGIHSDAPTIATIATPAPS